MVEEKEGVQRLSIGGCCDRGSIRAVGAGCRSRRRRIDGRQAGHQILNLNTELRELDSLIEERFRRHRHAKVIESMPGFEPLLGAEFLAATGGDVSAVGTADRLAGISPA